MTETPSKTRVWAIELAGCVATGVLLGVIGPFGSFLNDGRSIRVTYWVTVFLACGLVLGLTIRIVAPRARHAGIPGWACPPTLAVLVSIPLATFTRAVATTFRPAIGDRVGLIEWYGQTVVIGLICFILHRASRTLA